MGSPKFAHVIKAKIYMLRAIHGISKFAPIGARALCMTEGVSIDKVSRVFTCKVKDDPSAHKMDLAMDDYLTALAEQVPGYDGAARLVCKSEWDYKLVVKFADLDSLKGYMSDHHERLLGTYLPPMQSLAVKGEVKQQNFVYDDIE